MRVRPMHRIVEIDLDPEARRLAREGLGWEDIRIHLGVSERDARAIVFGKAAAAAWERRRRERSAEAESLGEAS